MLKRIPGLKSFYYALLGVQHYIRSWRSPFLRRAPAGHYLSPLPSLEYIRIRAESLFDQSIEMLPGINLNQDKQIELLEAFSSFEKEFPYSQKNVPGMRYTPENAFFPPADALILYSFLRHYRPKNVIEVGSGYSSAVTLDTIEHFLQNSPRLTFIEPYPTRLNSLLQSLDNQKSLILEQPVQNIPLDTFKSLEANDFLFIDSSHILRIGSDVAYIIFEILPALAPGVLIHFHDVFWPFEYPQDWYEQGYCFNEDHFLRSFLQFNENFSILFFTSYLQVHQAAAINTHLPFLSTHSGCSLWLVKNN
jgi:predicted O-methyltransferase YrrM